MELKSIRRLDGQGRVILPAHIRKALNLSQDSKVTIELTKEGNILIKPDNRKPHGRLIDADALIKDLMVDPVECPGCPEPEYLEEFIELLREAPTAMPAEEETE